MVNDSDCRAAASLSGLPDAASYQLFDWNADGDGWRIVRYELEHTAVPRPASPGYAEFDDLMRDAANASRSVGRIRTGDDLHADLQSVLGHFPHSRKHVLPTHG